MEQPGAQEQPKAIAAERLGLDTATLTVESDAFADGTRIPQQFAGAHGRSPSLRWSEPPPATREIVVLCEDPDAPRPQPFVHWVITGLPPDTIELPEGLPPSPTPIDSGAVQGRNDMRKHGYYGPQPPPGHGAHHYHFQVFAVDRRLDVTTPADRDHLVRALRGHVVAWGELVGTYEA